MKHITLVRIAMCVAGIMRVSAEDENVIFKIPYAGDNVDKLHPEARSNLDKIVREHGGGRTLKFKNNFLEFSIPESKVPNFYGYFDIWINDKEIKKFFNVDKLWTSKKVDRKKPSKEKFLDLPEKEKTKEEKQKEGKYDVSSKTVIIKIPYAKGMDAYKLERELTPKAKLDLTNMIKDHGGNKLRYEDGYVEIEIPQTEASKFNDKFDKWIEDKKIQKLFDFKKLTRSIGDIPSKKAPEEKKTTPQAEKKETPKQEKTPKKEQEKKQKKKEAPESEKPIGDGFRVEIPISMGRFTKRLQNNADVKSILEKHKGKPGKGNGLVLEFPDKKKKKEILDEIAETVSGSGFLKDILDMSEL